MDLPIIIPSHRRAGRVTTHRAVADALICIPESQKADYLEHHDEGQLLAHPDSVVGLPNKRQWIIERFGSVFMCDDDILSFKRIWRPAGYRLKRSTLTPVEARNVIETVAETAKELGAYLFGFASHCSPMTYNGWRPWTFGGYIPGGAFGILKGSKLWFPVTTLPCDDYWICLWNAYVHRYYWCDCRFAAAYAETYTGVGGAAESRMNEGERKTYEMLRRAFGKACQRKTCNTYANRKTTKREMNEWGRIICLPWKH
jgi:hypothetical protein